MESINLLLLNLIVYAYTITFGLVVDDEARYRTKKKFRDLPTKLYGAGTFGKVLWVDHLFTILLHSTVCVLIYHVFGQTQTAYLAAMLFAINPINSQGSIWMNGRRYVVNTILVLSMFLWAPWGAVLYMFTPFFQANAALSPLIFLFSKYPYLALMIPVFFIMGRGNIIQWYRLRAINLHGTEMARIRPAKIIIMVKTFAFYLFSCLIPQRVLMYNPFLESFGVHRDCNKYWYKKNWLFWRGVLAIVFVGYLIFHFGIDSYIGFGLAWYCLFIFQWTNLITTTQQVAERYCYLANIGLMVALAGVLQYFPREFSAGVLVFYALKLYQFMPMWKDMGHFIYWQMFYGWDDARPSIFRTNSYLADGDLYRAYVTCENALLNHPNDCKLNMIMSIICLNLSRVDFVDWARKGLLHQKRAEQFIIEPKRDELMSMIIDIKDQLNKRIKSVRC